MRTGVVLERSGGALPKMMPPFRFFAGGPLGSGRQYMSWIHRLDYIEMVRWIIETPAVDGPLNATAPHPSRTANSPPSGEPCTALPSCRRPGLRCGYC